ncbi:DUF4240 domain-containing protein [Lentzea sp.]|uniref:DUF4240 domain-containing protein n=1 Tax=Lentzea sp. TaxID=56099 RepID=UPI002ED378D5
MHPDNGIGADELTWFWDVVRQAGRSRDRLRAALARLDRAEIHRFQDIFVELATELQDEPYTAHVDADESEDGVEDIANWVVSQGCATYEQVLGNPRLMPSHVDVGAPDNLFSVAYEVFFERFGEPLDVM